MASRKLPMCGESQEIYCLIVVDHIDGGGRCERLLFTTRPRFEAARSHHGRNAVAGYRCDLLFRERLDAEPPLVLGPKHDPQRGSLGVAGWAILLAALVLLAAIVFAKQRGGGEVPHQPHKLGLAGSNPAPATKPSCSARSRPARGQDYCIPHPLEVTMVFSSLPRVGCAGALEPHGGGPNRRNTPCARPGSLRPLPTPGRALHSIKTAAVPCLPRPEAGGREPASPVTVAHARAFARFRLGQLVAGCRARNARAARPPLGAPGNGQRDALTAGSGHSDLYRGRCSPGPAGVGGKVQRPDLCGGSSTAERGSSKPEAEGSSPSSCSSGAGGASDREEPYPLFTQSFHSELPRTAAARSSGGRS